MYGLCSSISAYALSINTVVKLSIFTLTPFIGWHVTQFYSLVYSVAPDQIAQLLCPHMAFYPVELKYNGRSKIEYCNITILPHNMGTWKIELHNQSKVLPHKNHCLEVILVTKGNLWRWRECVALPEEPKLRIMADLEAVLADVSYLMAMEKSKSTPAARASRKIILPDHRWAALVGNLLLFKPIMGKFTS